MNRLSQISPLWWGAVAGAAAAGATVFDTRRVAAAAIAGGAMLWLAYRQTSDALVTAANQTLDLSAASAGASAAGASATGHQPLELGELGKVAPCTDCGGKPEAMPPPVRVEDVFAFQRARGRAA